MATYNATRVLALLRALLRAPVHVISPAVPDPAVPDPATCALVALLREHGSIPAVRVSSAPARGRERRYPYWGAVRYEIRLRRSDGMPTLIPCERASSDRRSRRLARDDADALAEREGRVRLDRRPGGLRPQDCARVVEQWRALAERASAE